MPEEEPINYSVVIPLEGRVPFVKRLMASIRNADLPAGTKVEILVLDSSAPPEAEAIQTLCADFGARYLRGSRSVRQKRNQGAAKTHYPYLLFLDSDCEASADLFVAYSYFVRSAEGVEWLAAAGPTHFRGGETPFTRLIQHSSLLSPFRFPKEEGTLLWATTSNFLVSRKAFELVGGFREDFPWRLGGDDTEFCLRLYEAGGRIRAVPRAVCFHSWQTWSSPLALVRRSFRWGWIQALILQDHKRFRRYAAPGLPVYFLGCLLVSLVATGLGFPAILVVPPVFLFLTIVIHAILSASVGESFGAGFVSDLVLALVECPFGFGKMFGSLSRGTLVGIFYRLGVDDADMDRQFPEMVKDLWSNNIALLLTALLLALRMVLL